MGTTEGVLSENVNNVKQQFSQFLINNHLRFTN